MNRLFIPIKKFENLYEISSNGIVRNKLTTKILKGERTKEGYRRIALYKYKRRYRFLLHRLVIENFIGECPIGLEICHNDGNATNNNIKNLRFDTRSNNQLDRFVNGNISNYKLKITDIPKIRKLINLGISQRKIAELFNVSQQNISIINCNKSWSHLNT